jgi:histidine ammonia-lyase
VTDQRVVLTGADLTVPEVEAVARRGAEAVLDPAAITRMAASRAVVDELVDAGAGV